MKSTPVRTICLILSMTISLSGCSAFRSSTQTVTVTTDQNESEIFINGSFAGKGTAQLDVKRNQNVSIMAKQDGYMPVQRSIGKSLNTTGILDIVGGLIILLPLFGLLAPGAYSLDETNVMIMMIEK